LILTGHSAKLAPMLQHNLHLTDRQT